MYLGVMVNMDRELAPLFDYTEVQGFNKPHAPHDLGVYPNAFGRINADEEDMPIEESANMLIMVAAILERSTPQLVALLILFGIMIHW